eukprot:TRINITY_DN32335_c0_g1_i1.p1 TRINITY_DN32335_c0_g1~~TRINITY_DN32335_c0_g1_i1.p1  ORF type:complete len:484 (-),score=88.46 TRINITY_DN32335_c0_g1_i1:76-1527(-)
MADTDEASYEFGSSMFDPSLSCPYGNDDDGDTSRESSADVSYPSGSHDSNGQGRQSLVFSGGGDFLSKYNTGRPQQGGDLRASSGDAEARRRRRTASNSGSSESAKGAGPDRANVQINSLLVHAKTVDKILQVVDAHFNQFNAVNMITGLHRLATMVAAARKGALRRDARFKRLIHRLSDTLRTAESGVLKPQDLSNVAWALTKLGLLNSVLFGHLAVHIVRTIHNFEPVNLSMTLWAFARSGFLDEKLFRATAAEVKNQLPSFKPQQIANTTWAIAKSGYEDEELFSLAADLALKKLDDFEPMNYSMLLYSFALARQPHPKLFEEVGKKCSVQTLSRVSGAPHVVTNLALAFSEAGVVDTRVFDSIAKVTRNTLNEYRAQQIATLAQAFARAKVRNEKLFASLSDMVIYRLPEFKAQDMKDLLAAYDELGMSTDAIASALERRASGEAVQPPKNPWAVLSVVVLLPLLTYVVWRVHDLTGLR